MSTQQSMSLGQHQMALGEARADAMVESQEEFLDALVRLRTRHGKSVDEVAQFMGVNRSDVLEFEDDDSNPTLQMLCLYALAIGARYRMYLADDCEGQAAGIWESANAFTHLASSTGIASGEFGDCTAGGNWDYSPDKAVHLSLPALVPQDA